MSSLRDTNREFIDRLKNNPCEFCGQTLSTECMDFDHKDPSTKSFAISKGIDRARVILEAELDKCRLLCCYCHATITHQYIHVHRRSPMIGLQHEINVLKESKPCADCGRYFKHWLMEFDHLDGKQKKNRISRMIGSTSAHSIKEEIKKCQLLCIGCHRLITRHRRISIRSHAIDAYLGRAT